MARIFSLVFFIIFLHGCDQADSADGSGLTLQAGQKGGTSPQPDEAVEIITVYKSPTCGCCVKWADHLEANGFRVVLRDSEELGKIKHKYGVPTDMRSCHTATIGEYVIEGHVPAADIQKLLRTQPPQRILAVPGMPLGSPGMEHPNGSMPYNSLLVAQDGKVTVFERHDDPNR